MGTILDEEEVAIVAIPLAVKEDLEDLSKLVKARYGSTRPVENMDSLLWSDMKTMFKPHVKMKYGREKKYPLTPPTHSMMLEKKLKIDFESEMTYQLCKLIKKQLKKKTKRKDTQVPQPSGPTNNVADNAVHKELGDRLVRDATTASSLEVELDSGNTLQSDKDSMKLDELMELCSNLQNRVLDLEKTKTTQRNEIHSLKIRVKKLEKRNKLRTHILKRLYKVGLSVRVESSKDEESLGEDASKQERRINANKYITLVNNTNIEMFNVDDLGGEEVFVAGKNDNVVEEVVNATQVSTAATTVTIFTKEITLAQALEALKISKPKMKRIVFQDNVNLQQQQQQQFLHNYHRTRSMLIYMLVEKKYPLKPPTLSLMLEKKLQIDYECEMAYQLCITYYCWLNVNAVEDGKELVIDESFIRRDLQIADEEGSTMPNDPHHTPTILQPSSIQPQKTKKYKNPKRKDTQVPQPSVPTENVADEAVHKELRNKFVRDATTASSLEAEQDNSNITMTQSKATPNKPSSQGTILGGGPKCQETIGILLFKLERLGEDTSKQGRRIDSNEDITLVNDADIEMFDMDDVGGEEVFVTGQNDNVVEEVVNAAQVITVAIIVTIITKEITLARALKALKTSNPKVKGVIFQDQKDQIRLDEEASLKLQAEFDEKERLARES
nr:hypothetical protein [Tanacetum cinerariifolium]